MKYYTPELFVMGQSGNDDVLDEQARLWEEAGARYAHYLAEVRPSFPKGIRRLFNRYYLHDSRIHLLVQRERYFQIELRLDTPPRSFLTFRYRLLRPAEVNKEALPPAYRAKGAGDWLYAEIERVSREDVLKSPYASTWVKDDWLTQVEDFDRKGGSTWPFWAHRILLSNGWELALYFNDLAIQEDEDLLIAAQSNGDVSASGTTSPKPM